MGVQAYALVAPLDLEMDLEIVEWLELYVWLMLVLHSLT
jgi:hypothetical protein